MLPDICLSNFSWTSSLSPPSLHIYHHIDGNVTILSQSFLSDESYHWFDVSFSPDVFILDVVLRGLASSSSQQSHLVGVEPCFIKLCTHASTCSCGVNVACSCQFQFGFREWFICVIYYHINFRMPPHDGSQACPSSSGPR